MISSRKEPSLAEEFNSRPVFAVVSTIGASHVSYRLYQAFLS